MTTFIAPGKRSLMLDVREERSLASPLELRENKATGDVTVRGYAATYEPYDCYGGPDAGGWVEQLAPRAFDTTLAAKPDVMLLLNHGGAPLARTAHGNNPGTMTLTQDRRGLLVEAGLDPSDPDVQALLPKMRRGDLDEMSFSFRVKDQDWDSNYTKRSINELSLQKGDVSIVNYGMNPNTHMSVMDEINQFASLSLDDLAEVRGLDAKKVDRAIINLSALRPAQKTIIDMAGSEVRKIGDPSPSKPLVPYADPGYRSDGKKRYPVDTEAHARSAWQYINMPQNQGGYTEAQVAGIRNRVASALRKFGVEMDVAQPYTKEVETPEETTVSPTTPASPGLDQHAQDRGYDPETGEGRADGHPADCTCADCMGSRADGKPWEKKDDDGDDDEENSRVLGDGVLAAALDASITHAYALAEGNEAVRAVLRDAQDQLNQMRGIEGDGGEVQRQLKLLHSDMGLPTELSVADASDFIARMGTAAQSLHRVEVPIFEETVEDAEREAR